jgi:hypothetical protein
MVHGGLSSLKILLHIIVSVNPDAKLKDHCKVRINASKKLYQASPILINMPLDNPRIQSKPGGPWPRSSGTCGLSDGSMCQA